MKIESLDKESFISIEYVDSELERYPSVVFCLSVSNEGFTGINKDVWFELDRLKEFVKDIQELELKRHGKASFESMSPNEFNLVIESYDLSGHMMLKFKITKFASGYRQDQEKILSGGFEIDPSYFSEIVNQFERLADESKYPPPQFTMLKDV